MDPSLITVHTPIRVLQVDSKLPDRCQAVRQLLQALEIVDVDKWMAIERWGRALGGLTLLPQGVLPWQCVQRYSNGIWVSAAPRKLVSFATRLGWLDHR